MTRQQRTVPWGFLLGVFAVAVLIYASGSSEALGWFLGLGVVCGVLCLVLSDRRQMGPGLAFWLGMILGPLGLLVVAMSEPTRRTMKVQVVDQRVRTLTPPPPGESPGWLADPAGRFEQRYWDGVRWTEHVISGTDQTTDQP